ncbi:MULTISPECIES: toxin-antitoxin system YwqK family antitoxin [Flavobacterium]|uniref:Membrane-binding protein n=2 Tax=Flavobacterium TaxID=237 RepID=A0A940XIJ5_9FLAO|nr:MULTISPECIES: membrane-binding protein [Flavobacterium]MBP4139823.1 membrane-binding protein [Flavobacterium geliluteum]MDX6181165.1 membrane-binding protein [Flavobacterium sp. Fl-33]MDX6184766.1 membrane-binding protein [Flavobacterium sp. Fl-77]UFH39864.1 membrane-binding protein [Flavobacterium sp. F-70]
MKKCVILVAILFSGILVAQESKPELEVVGNTVKATYYYDNGNVQQEGFFKDGKLDGIWVSYDEKGNKTAVAEYKEGVKTGKWMYFNEKTINQVAYSDNKIESVKNLQKNALADRN